MNNKCCDNQYQFYRGDDFSFTGGQSTTVTLG